MEPGEDTVRYKKTKKTCGPKKGMLGRGERRNTRKWKGTLRKHRTT
jgi:hypothetical protein